MRISKTILIVVSMLITGFTIGFFTAGRMARMRIDKHRNMMQNILLEKQFIAEKIDLSKSQEAEVFPTLDSMLTLQKAIRQEHHNEMKNKRKIMFESIRPHLTPDQLKNLRQFTRKQRPPQPPVH